MAAASVEDIAKIAGKESRLLGKSGEEFAAEMRLIASETEMTLENVTKALEVSGKLDAKALGALQAFKASPEMTSAFASAAREAGLVSHPLAADASLAARAGTAIREGAGAAGAAAKKAVQNGINNTGDFLNWAKKSCGENPKTCVGVALGSAAAIYAADKYLKVKNYKGKITKIEAYKDGGLLGFGGTDVAKVTYAEAIDILPSDVLTFSGTNCQPSIDGDATPYKVATGTEVWIKLDTPLQAPGSKGDFKITTGVMERLGQAVGVGAGAAGRAAGTAAGAAAGGAASGLGAGGSSFLSSFTSGAGLWLTLLLCCLCFAFIIFKFIL